MEESQKEDETSDTHNPKAFEEFKEKKLRGTLEELAELRSAYYDAKGRFYKRVDAWIFGALALAGGFFVIASGAFGGGLIYLPVAFVLLLFFRHYRIKPYRKKYERKFKEDLIRPTLSFFGDDLQYFPRQGIPDPKIKGSLLFPFDHDIGEGYDLVKGSYQGHELRFSELKLIEKKKVQTQNGTTESRIVLFQGLFLIAEMEEDIQCTVVIRPKGFKNTQKKLMGGFHVTRSHDTSANLESPEDEEELEPINLEDPEFEELFDVYGNDQIKARQLLNMNAINEIKAFQREQEDAVFISYQGSTLYAAVEMPGGFLDPQLDAHVKRVNFAGSTFEVPGELLFSWGSGKGVDTEEQLEHFYKDLEEIFSIMEDLDPKALKKGSKEPDQSGS